MNEIWQNAFGLVELSGVYLNDSNTSFLSDFKLLWLSG